ncbi:MAG: cation transporter [Firmicutes bacterium]|jgi:divalent metal cation (Fe/Co/Zn/Cd) transporter|nr:cation transporter [Bacillota bacterium]NLL88542.1 cation transporter [Bacillota bacterium]HKM17267.1 cation transporter [Limnochordia bacterium]
MKQKGERTLLASVILSSPGPLVLGIALFFGRSSTQIADFIRRTSELAAIIVSLIIFRIIHKGSQQDNALKRKLESIANRSVGTAMLLSGFAMLIVAALSFNAEKGNVVPSLIIAFLGVITNSWFWFRYRKLDREQPDTILSVQSKLYLAKSVVDISVAIALAFVALTPTSPFVGYVDLTGAVVVAAYLMITGINTIRGRQLLQAPV